MKEPEWERTCSRCGWSGWEEICPNCKENMSTHPNLPTHPIINICRVCNDRHKGGPKLDGHVQQSSEGIGYIRLMSLDSTERGDRPEFCFRCGCEKSSWINIPNDINLKRCVDHNCLCHKAERAS